MDMYVSLDGTAEIEIVDDKLREEKRTKKTGLLSWLKPRVCKIPFTSTLSISFSFLIQFSVPLQNVCSFLTEALTLLCIFGSLET